MITVSKRTFQRLTLIDNHPDTSYLEQEGYEERLAAYRADDFHFVGIRARCIVFIPHGKDKIIHEVESPGLWGIESDSDDDHMAEVFLEECQVLADMLTELGVKVS